MTKEQMMDSVIKKYGFEASESIGFCAACEDPVIDDFEISFIYCLLMDY